MGRILAGNLLMERRVVEGWMEVVEGHVGDWDEGPPPRRADETGWIVPSLVNAHTHVADTFLRDRPKPSGVAELVGPGGWKHQQLANADPGEMQEGVGRIAREMQAVGVRRFVDFREGGLRGALWLKQMKAILPVEPIIMGRPRRGFDADEARSLLATCHGIGLSGLRDLRQSDLDDWADACKRARVPLAIHVSEDRRDDIDAALALEPTFVVHMSQASDSDLRALADADVPIVACPRSNRFFDMTAPVRRMVEAGCTVAVGTDNGMINDGDVLEELRRIRRDWPEVTDEQLLRMASHAGHHVLRLSDRLPPRVGEVADLTVVPFGALS